MNPGQNPETIAEGIPERILKEIQRGIINDFYSLLYCCIPGFLKDFFPVFFLIFLRNIQWDPLKTVFGILPPSFLGIPSSKDFFRDSFRNLFQASSKHSLQASSGTLIVFLLEVLQEFITEFLQDFFMELQEKFLMEPF